jgi:hypothetical protein
MAIVCVSEVVTYKLIAALPTLKERIVHIPFGVEPLAELPERARLPGEALKVAYCGRLSFHQKRVQDLARIINQCHDETSGSYSRSRERGRMKMLFSKASKHP